MPQQVTTTYLEPHPSTFGRAARSNAYVYGSGRGGAGNYKSYPHGSISDGSTNLPKPAEKFVRQPRSGLVMSGIGGAGNARPAAAVRHFDLDEELDRIQKHSERTPRRESVVLVGRGGAGNRIKPRGGEDSDSSLASTGSAGSSRARLDSVVDRIRRSIARD